jgi:hypothetical protein
MEWFLDCLGRAIDGAQVTLSAVLAKARFWDQIKGVAMNDRLRLMINRLRDGFEGKLTTSKYAKLAKCSQDTAHRDISRWSTMACSFAIPKAAAAQVIRSRPVITLLTDEGHRGFWRGHHLPKPCLFGTAKPRPKSFESRLCGGGRRRESFGRRIGCGGLEGPKPSSQLPVGSGTQFGAPPKARGESAKGRKNIDMERTVQAVYEDVVLRPVEPIPLERLHEADKLTPELVFRDPYLLDFLGLKDTTTSRPAHLQDHAASRGAGKAMRGYGDHLQPVQDYLFGISRRSAGG